MLMAQISTHLLEHHNQENLVQMFRTLISIKLSVSRTVVGDQVLDP